MRRGVRPASTTSRATPSEEGAVAAAARTPRETVRRHYAHTTPFSGVASENDSRRPAFGGSLSSLGLRTVCCIPQIAADFARSTLHVSLFICMSYFYV